MREVTATATGRDLFLLSRSHMSRRASGAQKLLGGNAYVISTNGLDVHLSDGRSMLDVGTWACTLLGHRYPPVADAVRHELGAVTAAPRGLATAPAPRLAERLVELAQPSRLRKVWFGANGADAVEAALKLCRIVSGRRNVVALAGGFHGRTLGALSISDADTYVADKATLAPHTYVVAVGDPPLSPEFWSDVAALVVEVVQGNGTGRPLPTDDLMRICTLARNHGVAVIADEIQTGLWRCGSFSMAVEIGLDPDIVLVGKALASGVMPLSALISAPELFTPLDSTPTLHSQTFAGHPLSAAAGLATLEYLPSLADEHYVRVSQWVADLAEAIEPQAEARGADAQACGLMLTLTFVAPQDSERFVRSIAHAGLLVSPCDGNRRAVRLLVPLVIDARQQTVVHKALLAALANASAW